jgi:hypothetical protein
MKRSRFTEEQIIGILREQETGIAVASGRAPALAEAQTAWWCTQSVENSSPGNPRETLEKAQFTAKNLTIKSSMKSKAKDQG